MPQNGGKTIKFCNGTGTLRKYLLKNIGNQIHKKHNMVLVDLDLVSCFTRILVYL